ncbi:MAG: TetR/AcrR family transcriptional regulator C-terminal domain-containing protein [Pseudomonadaceae bacterium]|nr:TetR/AcrR family transcriptional regulator C-terminal domain-containing protein [Pseudomonadaceae bacterium]
MDAKNRGRPAKVNLSQIIQAALTIGLRDLSMTRLAAEMGVAMSTLYHHVCGIEEVKAVVADQLISDVDVLAHESVGMNAHAFLLAAGYRLRQLFAAAPGFAEIARSTPRLQGQILKVHEKATQRLVDMGYEERRALLAVRVIADYVEASTARDERWSSNCDVGAVLDQNREDAANSGCAVLIRAFGEPGDNYLDGQFELGLNALAAGLTQTDSQQT